MTSLRKIVALFLLVSGMAHAKNEQDYILFEGTESPDGRYALAWGIPYTPLDADNLDQVMETIDYDAIENFLVDLKRKQIIATIGSAQFPGANHGSLEATWRPDGKAAFIVEGGKWGYVAAFVVYVVAPEKEYDNCSDVIPVTVALTKAVIEKMTQEHPDEAKTIQDFVISAAPRKWVGENQVVTDIYGEVPKSEDGFFYEGTMTIQLPGPATVVVVDGQSGEKLSDDGRGAVSPAKITADSVGPIKIGMSVAEARRAMGNGVEFSRTSDGEGIPLIAISDGTNSIIQLYAGEIDPESDIDGEAIIEFIQVFSPDFKTADGVGVGMSLSLAEKTAYGDVREITLSEIESREYADFQNHPSGLSFRVEHNRQTAGNYRNNEMSTSRYNPGAKIAGIEIYGPNIMADGKIGGIKLGLTDEDVLGMAEDLEMGEAFKGQDEMWEAFGQAVQKWIFPDAGISMDMISDEIGGPKSVLSISVKAPFAGETGRGIKLGDAKADVIAAYADIKTDPEEADGFFEGEDVHLVGSIYGGMIFTFENGKLAEIFLGAAAE